MPLTVIELFGHRQGSPLLEEAVLTKRCPFIGGVCRKFFSNGMPSGLCTAAQTKDSTPVICCPQRLYANDYQILRRVCDDAFGVDIPLLLNGGKISEEGDFIIPFGQKMGKELKVSARDSRYSFDWILALVGQDRALKEFVAVEVQTIDTTGSYQRQSWEIQQNFASPHVSSYAEPALGKSSNFNFENVNKRILPQLITKGHILRLESMCKKGLFFVCPTPVLSRITKRLGGADALEPYGMQPGSITFHDYTIDPDSADDPSPLIFGHSLTTTLEMIHMAFLAPKNLGVKDAYANVVKKAVAERLSSINGDD
jgi:hypothetical protein